MFDILQNFERAAIGFMPLVLIVPGLAAVIVGLFVWLGGLCLRRLIAALAGAAVGGAFGFFLIGHNAASAMLAAALTAFLAIIFERLFIIILTVVLAVVVAFAIVARPYIQQDFGRVGTAHQLQDGVHSTPYETKRTGFRQNMETVNLYAAEFVQSIKRICSRLPVYIWVIIVIVPVIFVPAGFFFRRLISALSCATLGTAFIFAGIVLLLLYKGSSPITSLSSSQPFYATVFGGMMAFGTIEQLLLCRRGEKRKKKKKAIEEKQDSEHERHSWRNK